VTDANFSSPVAYAGDEVAGLLTFLSVYTVFLPVCTCWYHFVCVLCCVDTMFVLCTSVPAEPDANFCSLVGTRDTEVAGLLNFLHLFYLREVLTV
jgi:hypothetical protein